MKLYLDSYLGQDVQYMMHPVGQRRVDQLSRRDRLKVKILDVVITTWNSETMGWKMASTHHGTNIGSR